MVTATDPAGGTASDTFNLTVSPAFAGTVQFTMQTLDLNGTAVTTIDPGATFTLVVSVQDVRANPTGVFAAFLDVDFDGTFVTTNGVITHSTTYVAGTSGPVVDGTMATAQIDEVGGSSTACPALGPGVFEVFRHRLRGWQYRRRGDFLGQRIREPVATGCAGLWRHRCRSPIADIDFGTTSIAIGGLTAPLSVSFSAPLNNPLNPYDVNGDSDVSPLDALLVINEFSGHAAASGPIYVDVNADGDLSPLDALMVINELNPSAARAPLSSGVIASDVDEEEGSFSLYDAIFADEFDV